MNSWIASITSYSSTATSWATTTASWTLGNIWCARATTSKWWAAWWRGGFSIIATCLRKRMVWCWRLIACWLATATHTLLSCSCSHVRSSTFCSFTTIACKWIRNLYDWLLMARCHKILQVWLICFLLWGFELLVISCSLIGFSHCCEFSLVIVNVRRFLLKGIFCFQILVFFLLRYFVPSFFPFSTSLIWESVLSSLTFIINELGFGFLLILRLSLILFILFPKLLALFCSFIGKTLCC